MKKKLNKLAFLRTINREKSGLVYALFLVFYSSVMQAQGNLLIFPKRLVFENTTRMQTVSLINTGADTVNYLISVVQYRMQEDGKFERIEKPDSAQLFADDFLRVYPRHIVLPPGKAQIVKIQLTNTHELQPGEYRSHLYFRAEADKKPLGEEEVAGNPTSISVTVVSVFGITIPVIIRTGAATTKLAITSLRLETLSDTLWQLKVSISRTGNMSAYGDVFVDYISDKGKTTRLGFLNGMSIYTPYPARTFTIPLIRKSGVDLQKGHLHITYQTQPDAKSVLLAEADYKPAEKKMIPTAR